MELALMKIILIKYVIREQHQNYKILVIYKQFKLSDLEGKH